MRMNGRLAAWALFAGCISAFVSGCTTPSSEAANADTVFPAEPLSTVTGDEGQVVIEVRTSPNQPPTRGRTNVELRVFGLDGEPLEDLELEVVPFMPDMAHAAANEPQIEPLGGGRYEARPVDMIMAGRWALLTTIEGSVHDSAEIEIEIE